MVSGKCQCTGCVSENCGMNPFWRNHRPNPDSTMCTWDLNYRCKRICKCCICRKCKGRGHHCHCEEEDLPAVKAPQPSGDAVVEPRIAASVKSSEAYMWAPIPVTSEELWGIPSPVTKPPKQPPKTQVAADAGRPIPLPPKPPPKTQVTADAGRPIPLPPKPPPKTQAGTSTAISSQVPQPAISHELVQLLEAKAVVADQRIQELQWQIHHLMSRLRGLEARVHELEDPGDNPWRGLQ